MKTIIITLLVISSFASVAQTKEEFTLLKKHSNTSINKGSKYRFSESSGSITGSLFVFYKVFFSSQDSKTCSFSLSCSAYSVQAMKKQGFFIGLLNTFDRLTRCHGLRAFDYPIDEHSHLLIDPVRDIHNEKL